MWQPSSADAQIISAAGFGKIGDKLSINAGVKYFMHQSYDISNSEGIYSGSFTPSEYAASLGVAYKLIPSLSAALTLSYVGSDLGAPKAASAGAANSVIYEYQTKGLVEKVKRDFFVAISLETKQPLMKWIIQIMERGIGMAKSMV